MNSNFNYFITKSVLNSQINSRDTPGDEGAIFATLVLGEDLSESRLQQLREEDDSEVVIIDGESIAIEQAFDVDDTNIIKDGLEDLLKDVFDNVVEELVGEEENIFLSLISQEIIDTIKDGDDLDFFTDIGSFIDEVELNLSDNFIPDDFVREINKQLDTEFENVTISLVEDNGDEVIFGLDIINSFTDDIKLDANEDLGFPNLGLSFDGDLDFSFDTSAAINFGVNVENNEFFVDPGLEREIDINLNIQNSEELVAELGNFKIEAFDRSINSEEELVEENPGKAFQASLNFGLDLQDNPNEEDYNFKPTLIGELNINQLLEIDSGIQGLPSIDTTLDYNAQYDFLNNKFVAPEMDDNDLDPVFLLDGIEFDSENISENIKTFLTEKVSELVFDNLGGLSRIIEEFDRFLAEIYDTLNSDIFELDIPFIGDALSGNIDATGFIKNIRNSLSDGFQNFADDGVEALVTKLDNLEYITAESEEKGNEIIINIGLDSTDGDPINFETNLAPDLGVLDSLGLDISAKADINLDFLAKNALEVTINKTNGTIGFDLGGNSSEEDNDLNIGLSLKPNENTVLNQKLGFLDVNLESALGNNEIGFEVDIDLDTFDYEFNYSDLSVIDLYKLEVAAPDIKGIGGLPTVTLPKFSTILSFDFNNINTDSDGEFELPFIFKDVSINAESLYEGFLGSFIDTLKPIIGKDSEIGKFVEQITANVEPLSNIDAIRNFFDNPNSDLSSGNGDGEVSLIEIATNPVIADVVGGEKPKYQEFIEAIKEFGGFINDIDDFIKTLSELVDSDGNINLGDIFLDDISSGNMTPTRTDDRSEDFQKNKPKEKGEETDENKPVLPQGLKIPLFEDPLGTAFNFLTGTNNVSLIEYTIPELSFGTELSQFFPMVGPLGVRLGGSLSAKANLGFGFDTYGLQTGNQVQGFYIIDDPNINDNIDPIEFNLNARVTAEGGAELGVGRGFVGGNLTGDINFDLVDPDRDGRIRPSEISSDFTELFDISATLKAGLQAWYEIDLGFGLLGDALTLREDFDFGELTLLEIEPSEPPFNPALGYVVDGTLILNQGSDRAVGKEETEELFQISQSPDGTVEIIAFANRQGFGGVNKVEGNGRDENDTLEAFVEVTVAVEFDGGSGNDTLIGGSGDDTLLGGSDGDRLEGKSGNDRLEGESGDDSLFGGTGNDILEGDRGNDNLVGEGGNDILEGDRGRDTLSGGEGNDNLSGGSDRDTLDGGSGNDILDGGSGEDYLDGFTGDDLLKGEFGKDTLYGSDGEDTLEGGDSNDYLDGGKDDDTLRGDSGEDTLYGRTGNDSLDGGFGEDTLYGEAGNDTLDGNLGDDSLYGSIGNDSLIGGVGNDILEGETGNDILEGSDGEDTLEGGEGNDSLVGGSGKDSLIGYLGNDSLDGSSGEDELYGGSGDDSLVGGEDEDKLYGGIDNDNLDGSSGEDELYGGEGDDLLLGNIGNDSLEGESGKDTLRGGQDRDTLIGGGGEDLLEGQEGTDILFGGLDGDLLRGGEQDDVLFGESGRDTLEGGEDNDSLVGGEGDDSLEGGSGEDTLRGEDGFDILRGESGDDVLEGEGQTDSLFGGDGKDTLRGGEDSDFLQGDDDDRDISVENDNFNDVLDGGDGNDELFGASGDDRLIGGDGDDTITGGFGNDTLIGDDTKEGKEKRGKNVFVLAPNEGIDIIKDFTLLPDNFNPEVQETDDADIILLSDGLSFNFIEIKEDEIVDSSGETISGAAIIDKDTNETLAILEGIDPAKLTRAYFDEENVAPDRLEFESKKPVYAEDETVSLVNTLVRDANGIQDVELIDFWLKGYEGEDVWTDLNNLLTELNGNLGLSDLNNLNTQTLIGEKIAINNAHWFDYDNDNDLDIFSVRQGYEELNSFQSIYLNESDDKFNQTNFLPGYSITGNAWADYDDDGDLDLVGELIEEGIQQTGIWQNEDNNFTFVELTSIKNGIASWGDYDEDEDLDLIVTGVDSEDETQVSTQLFNNDGEGNLEEVETNLPGNVGTVDWGDLDKDGDLDLIISGNLDLETNNFTTKVYLNNEGEFEETFSVDDVKQGTVKWGDFNGDDNLDFALVGGIETPIIIKEDGEERTAIIDRGFGRIYEGDGSGEFNLLEQVEGVQDGSIDWGDYDKDGDSDLLITGLSNQFRLTVDGEFVRIPVTYIYRYEEETNSFSQIIPNLPEVGGGNSSWGDYDNDGDLDILVSGFDFFNNPLTQIYRNDGFGTYGNEWQQSDFGNNILFGAEVRRDIFVIDRFLEIETIYNFKPEQDLLYLSNGLKFNDLEFQDLESGDTAIVLKSNDRTLAIIENVTSDKITRSNLVISLNKNSSNVTVNNFDGERSLIYLTGGLNNNIIEVVADEENVNIVFSGTNNIIATINNASVEDVENNLLVEKINFIDPIFTAFNNDSRLASFDYQLNNLEPGTYTLKGTAYDRETANKIISQGVTLINPSLEIPDSEKEFVIEDRAYDRETANQIISQNITSSTETLEEDIELIELEGNKIIDWIYQIGSVNPTDFDESISNTFDQSRGITTTIDENNNNNVNVHFVGVTRGLLPDRGTLNNGILLRPGLPEVNLRTSKQYSWYGSLNSEGEQRQITQSFENSSFQNGEIGGIVSDNQNNLYTIGNYSFGLNNFTRIEEINPVTGDIIRAVVVDVQSSKRDVDIAVDSLGNLYSVGFTNNSGTNNAFLSQYDLETRLFNSESVTIGTDSLTEGRAISISSDDSIYITGQTTGELVRGISKDEFDQFDIWIAKYQNNEETGLEQIWIQQFSLGEVEFVRDIATDSENNVYIIGEITGIEGGDIVGKDRIWFTKFQANGDRLWTRILDFDSLADIPQGITIDNSDNIFLTGENRKGNPNEGQGQTDVFFAKYNTNGNLLWTQDFGTSANDGVEDLTVDSQGNLYLTGGTASDLSDKNKGTIDAWVAKFNNLEKSDRLERERFILGDSTGNFYGSGKIARITGFDAAIGDTIQLHGSSEDYKLDTYFIRGIVEGVSRVVETGVNISYKSNNEEIARIVDANIAETDRQLGLRVSTEFQAGNIEFVSGREDNVESIDFVINNNGTSEDDELIGTVDTADVLTGGDGNDRLVGNLGGDYLDGGTGNDTLYSGTETSTEEIEPLTEEIETPDNDRTYSFLYGWEGNDELKGSDFKDELYGGTGNDSIQGGAGNDTLEGNAGNDTLEGGTGTDIISYRDELASLTIDFTTGTLRDSQNGTDTFSEIEGAIASEYSDTIVGDSKDNIFEGLAGDDVITSAGGNDTINAGHGSDRVIAGNGNDTIINIDGNDTLIGGKGNDTYDLKEQEKLTVEKAFTALGGGNRRQGYIYNAENFPISFDTFRRFAFDRIKDKLAEFDLEIVTEENSEEPILDNEGFPLLRQKDYPLQILDDGGAKDTLILEEVDIQEVNLEDNKYPSTRGDRIGVAQRGNSLVIDYNKNVYPSLENDIVIQNFFSDEPGEAGTGFIETLDGIDSTEILALAQPFTPIDFEIPEIETGFWTNSGSWGDYDNDGDLDFAIASGDEEGNGFTRIYRNDEGKFVFAVSLEGYSQVNSLDWGDYDNDGDLDVVIVGYETQPEKDIEGNFFSDSEYKAAIFRNEGSDRFSNVESIDIESEANGEPLFATWGNYVTSSPDTDNTLDILLRGSSIPTSEPDEFVPGWSYQAVIEGGINSFEEVKPWQRGPLKDRQSAMGDSNNTTNAWGDYDNDGDLDVVVIDSDKISLYEKVDEFREDSVTRDFKEPKLLFTIDDRNEANKILKSSVSSGDYNNDGILDLLTTTYTNDNYSAVTVYTGSLIQNKDEKTEIEFTEVPTLIPNTYNGEASWGDYDNDGDLDILLIGTAGKDSKEGLPFAQIYRNNIDTKNTRPLAPTGLKISVESIVGYDGVATRFQWKSAENADIETEDISLTYNLRIGTTPGGSEILAAESINENGILQNGILLSPEIGNVGTNKEYILDITSGLERGVTYYWSVQSVDGGYLGSKFATESSFTYLPYDESPIGIDPVNGNSAWGDYDNDGDLDVVKGINLFNNNLGESDKIEFNDVSNLSSEITDNRIDNAWGDYDGDGNLDLAVTGNTTSIYRNNLDRNEFVSLDLSLPQVNNGTVIWGDYDNDGDLDLFLMGDGENGLIAQIYINNGESGFALDENQSELVGLSDGDGTWADYDRDGDLDLAVIGKNNKNITIAGIYQNNLGILNNFIPLQPEDSEYIEDSNPNSISWGDYDRDGYLDLLVTATTDSDSYHQIYRNNQDDRFSDIQAKQLGETSPNGKSAWADFNNDGQLDIILSGEEQAALENQNGNFQRTFFIADYTDELETTLAVADYDNDGDLDYLANATGNSNRNGEMSPIPAPIIYENLLQNKVNNLPVPPTELTAIPNKNSVTLEWNLGSDRETPEESLTYNLRVGTTPGGNDIVASMSNSEGLRSLPALGNVNNNLSWKLSDLPNGKYYWSVQAIDSTFAGSAFAEEGEFTISNPQIEIQNIEIIEGDSGETEAQFTVTLNVETISENITVDYTTVDDKATSGEDYEASNGTLTFKRATEDNPAELSKTIKVKILGDLKKEDPETFSIQLSNPSDNVEILTDRAIATIISEETDGQPLFPDYSFSELTVNDTETDISVERGSTITLNGAIDNNTKFKPENPPSYRLYLSKDQKIDPVLKDDEAQDNGLITNINSELELSEDISLVVQNANTKLEEGQYIFSEEEILIPATLEDGEYFLIAEVNPETVQPEKQLNNNLSVIPITITAPTEETLDEQDEILEKNIEKALETNPDLLIDLAVSDVNITDPVLAGESLDISYTLSNGDNSALIEPEEDENSNNLVTAIYLSEDNVPDASDRLLKETFRSESIAANSDILITDLVDLPNNISGEDYLFIVTYPIEQLDLNNDNNIIVIPLTISEPTITSNTSEPAIASNTSEPTITSSDNNLIDSSTIDDDTILGRSRNDSLTGLLGNDTIKGGSGNDSIDGGSDNDFLGGNKGNDTILGGIGEDRIVAGQDNDSIDGGMGNDTLGGNKGDDELLGGEGSDILRGGRGNDVLIGGVGNDTLVGGLGSDIFIIEPSSTEENRDTIRDFANGIDSLQLSGDLTFNELDIVSNALGISTLIKDSAGNTLAVLNDVEPDSIDESDFA